MLIDFKKNHLKYIFTGFDIAKVELPAILSS